MLRRDETYYELLKVDRKATVSEIVAAYHAAKNAFSKESIASYSLLSSEETEGMLASLEEAYLTLSNVDKRSKYDRDLDAKSNGSLLEVAPVAERSLTEVAAATAGELPVEEVVDKGPEMTTGKGLKEIREKRSLSLEDVARITKIPSRYLRAIEGDDFPKLPARVYLQGFIKNLAALYKLDPQQTAKSYLQFTLDHLPILDKAE